MRAKSLANELPVILERFRPTHQITEDQEPETAQSRSYKFIVKPDVDRTSKRARLGDDERLSGRPLHVGNV